MAYWIATFGLVAFGIAGSMTIGRPFLIVGVAMLLLGPLRHRGGWFWPPMLAVIAYNVTFWAISPLYCTAISLPDGAGSTSCSSLIGIGWPATAGGLSNASSVFDQTNRIGLVAAAATFVIALTVMLWRRRTRTSA